MYHIFRISLSHKHGIFLQFSIQSGGNLEKRASNLNGLKNIFQSEKNRRHARKKKNSLISSESYVLQVNMFREEVRTAKVKIN